MCLLGSSTLINFYPRPLRGGRPPAPRFQNLRKRISIHALCEEGDLLGFYLCLHRIGISIHALCEEGDCRCSTRLLSQAHFYPRPLRGGRPVGASGKKHCIVISIHALCEEGDPYSMAAFTAAKNFYPRPLRGGRRMCRQLLSSSHYFYPRPLRGGRLAFSTSKYLTRQISIHALCEAGDPLSALRSPGQSNFYPRPLRGGRLTVGDPSGPESVFLSTPSARRATAADFNRRLSNFDFYPRPLRGGRLPTMQRTGCVAPISIHALCEEGDSKNRDKISIFKQIIQHSARI